MLPFLKNRDDGVGSGAVETKQMETSEDEVGLDSLEAIAEDILTATKVGDKSLLKSALEALCEYVREEDIQQDKEMT